MHLRMASPGTLDELIAMIRGKRVVVLTGAGCSTESGIPDYRGVDTPPRARPPIQHREFVDRADARRRYWARSVLGWPRLAAAQPNDGHRALAQLEAAGIVAGLITQNVDGLHSRAGSKKVVELHGALARVKCLACESMTTRDDLQARLLAANPDWHVRANVTVAPDGDADLSDELVASFEIVACEAPCIGREGPATMSPGTDTSDAPSSTLGYSGHGDAETRRRDWSPSATKPAEKHDGPRRADARGTDAAGDGDAAGGDVAPGNAARGGDAARGDAAGGGDACGGVVMPDVVFFGGSVPRTTLDAAWATFDQAEVLLVIGSSLTVFSGYRFVRRAAERHIPVAILNRGPTRGDELARLRVDARAGEALTTIARAFT